MIKIGKNKNWLFQQASINAESKAITFDNTEISFLEFWQDCEIISNQLLSLGVKKGDHCVLLFQHNYDFYKIVCSFWNIGAIPIPINPNLSSNEISNYVHFVDYNFIFSDCENSKSGNYENFHLYPFVKSTNNSLVINDFQKDETAIILFTSGSSGTPKAVKITFNNLFESVKLFDNLVNQTNNDKWLASLPLYHIGGFMILVRSLICGCNIVFPKSLKTESLILSIKNHEPNFLSLVSTQFKRLLDEKLDPWQNLKALFLGGGPIDSNLLENKHWNIFKVYSSTETTSTISALDVKNNYNKLSSAGKALNSKMLTINKNGEITVSGETVAKGYYNNENKNFANNTYLTNDIGYLDEDGFLFIEGRKDDIIISGGEKISANEISNLLKTIPQIVDAYVIGINDKDWGEKIVGFVEINEMITNEQIKEYLKNKISSIKIPKEIYIIPKIPRNEIGKIRKNKLLGFISQK